MIEVHLHASMHVFLFVCACCICFIISSNPISSNLLDGPAHVMPNNQHTASSLIASLEKIFLSPLFHIFVAALLTLFAVQQWDSSELRDPLQMVIRFDGRRGSFAAVRVSH